MVRSRHQAQGDGGVAELQIEVDQRHPLARLGQTGGQVGGDERLAGAALGAEDDDALGDLGFLLGRQLRGDALERRALALADLSGGLESGDQFLLAPPGARAGRARRPAAPCGSPPGQD